MMLIPTRVRPSLIHGMGLFAVEKICQGTPVWKFQPGFDREFVLDQVSQLPEAAQRHLRWYGYVSKTTGNVILNGDLTCFMNHSEFPNTGVPGSSPDESVTRALQDIQSGEELTCNYLAFDADVLWKLSGPGTLA